MNKKIQIGLVILLIGWMFMEKKPSEPVVETMSCYDYIVDTMSQPQYWSDIPLYSSYQIQQEAENKLINGTGWTLIDEDHATFTRGYQGIMTISFHDGISVHRLSSEFQPEKEYEQHFDIFNHTVHRIYSDPYQRTDMTSYFEEDNKLFSIIEKTFTQYEQRFQAAGCPLLNQPEGTLHKYQNQKAVIPIQKDDHKIHAPWQQKKWHSEWTEDPLFIHLNKLEEIRKIQIENREYVSVMKLDQSTEKIAMYQPFFVLLTDKENLSEEIYFEHIHSYPTKLQDFVLYYLNELCSLLDIPTVYVVDSLPEIQSGQKEYTYDMTIEEVLSSNRSKGSQLLMFQWNEKEPILKGIFYLDVNQKKFDDLVNYIQMILNHKKIDNPFSEDYLDNFNLYYDLKWQRILGLR